MDSFVHKDIAYKVRKELSSREHKIISRYQIDLMRLLIKHNPDKKLEDFVDFKDDDLIKMVLEKNVDLDFIKDAIAEVIKTLVEPRIEDPHDLSQETFSKLQAYINQLYIDLQQRTSVKGGATEKKQIASPN